MKITTYLLLISLATCVVPNYSMLKDSFVQKRQRFSEKYPHATNLAVPINLVVGSIIGFDCMRYACTKGHPFGLAFLPLAAVHFASADAIARKSSTEFSQSKILPYSNLTIGFLTLFSAFLCPHKPSAWTCFCISGLYKYNAYKIITHQKESTP